MSLKHRAEAWLELCKKYGSIFLFYWQRRKALSMPDFKVGEAEFLPAALSLQAAPVSPSARWLARILITMLVVLLCWAIFGHTDIVVTAQGKIIPSAYTQSLASVEVAKVRAIYAYEGKKVKKGEILLELDPSIVDAEKAKAQSQWVDLTLQAARAEAMLQAIDENKSPSLPSIAEVPAEKWQTTQQHLLGDYRDYHAKVDLINSKIHHFATLRPMLEKRAKDYQTLAKQGDVSVYDALEKQQAAMDTQNQWVEAKNQLISLKEEARKNAYDQMQESRKQVGVYAEEINRTSAQGRLLTIKSPMDGTVNQLVVHTVGGVVPAAQPLLQIVPDQEKLEVEAMINNRDVGFIALDQRAAVKVETFQYTKYGFVDGVVSNISKDAIVDEKRGLLYTIRVALAKNAITVEDKEVLLAPGMAVTVDIKTGKRRIIEYVLSPILRHQKESLRER